MVSGAGAGTGMCCNGLRCVEIALSPALLSPSAPSLCPSVPFAAALCPCLQMCQLGLSPKFRNAVNWLCDGGFCFFVCWGVFCGGGGGFYCFVLGVLVV